MRGDQVWVYYSAASLDGGYALSEQGRFGVVARAVIRRDGFVSVDADYCLVAYLSLGDS